MESWNYGVRDDATFLSIIDLIPNALIVTGPDLSILYVNPGFIKLTGFGLEDVKGTRAPYPWWPPARHQEYLAELNVLKEGKRHKSDWLFCAKDGRPFWIKANVGPVMKDGQVQFNLACWTDITPNKMVEETLQKRLNELKTERPET
jgi:PAS domain S-box-containing protein